MPKFLEGHPAATPLPALSLLLSATLWGVIWYPLRLLENRGLHGVWATLLMFSAALTVGLAWSWPRRTELTRAPGLLLALALTGGWCQLAFIVAVIEGTVVRVMLLFYLSPLWAVLFGRLVLGEHPGRRGIAALAVAMVGAAIMLYAPALGLPWPKGAAEWLALSSGLTFALMNTLIRKAQSVSIQVKTAVAWGGVTLIAALWILGARLPSPPPDPTLWWGAAALGWGGMVVMTVASQYGVTHLPLHRSAVIMLFELVVAAVSAQWLTAERVSLREWAGGACIIVAAYLAAHARPTGAPGPSPG